MTTKQIFRLDLGMTTYVITKNLPKWVNYFEAKAFSSVLRTCVNDDSALRTLRSFLENCDCIPMHRSLSNKEIVDEVIKIIDNPVIFYYFVKRDRAMRPCKDEYVIDWIKKGIEYGDFGPYTWLQSKRESEGVDMFDDNLPAAERYFEGYDGNYNELLIRSMSLLKSARNFRIGETRPLKTFLGRNGSVNIGFCTKWGVRGSKDREQNIDVKQRIALGYTDD